MQVDYIIVGFGLAGLSFAEQLSKQNKSFLVYENNSQQASKVAGGIYNPVILKRFTPVWNADRQLDVALPFYNHLEQKLKQKYQVNFPIYRLFNSIEEQNNWYAALDKSINKKYMISQISLEDFFGIKAPYGFGKLKGTGKILIKKLLNDYTGYLSVRNKIRFNKFEYNEVRFKENTVIYNDVKATHIVFCEGFGVKDNPFFNHLPLQESKGELLTIYAPDLKIDFLLKSAVFIMPLGKGYFKVGATFNWKDKTSNPSEEGKQELLKKLNTFLTVPYKVIGQHAGVRPTVKDRRPLIGIHKQYKQLAVLNGLGTRGVMLAPTMAQELYNHIEFQKKLPQEISIHRFKK